MRPARRAVRLALVGAIALFWICLLASCAQPSVTTAVTSCRALPATNIFPPPPGQYEFPTVQIAGSVTNLSDTDHNYEVDVAGFDGPHVVAVPERQIWVGGVWSGQTESWTTRATIDQSHGFVLQVDCKVVGVKVDPPPPLPLP